MSIENNMRKIKHNNNKKVQRPMYVVHPNLGVTSTKRCHMPATFILLKCYNLQQTCCHHFLLNLSRSHLGSIFSRNWIHKDSLQNNIPLHISSKGSYNNVHEIKCRHYIYSYVNICYSMILQGDQYRLHI